MDADSTISISVKSTGFQFLSTFWSDDDKISIDISNTIPYESNGTFVYAFSLRDNKETIKNQVPFLKQKESQILNDTARLILTKLTQKKVRVALGEIDFLFEPQFGLYGSPKLYPDSVEIYGSEKELSNIVEVKTKTKTIESINRTDYYDLELQSPANTNVKLSDNKVKIHIPVERYTEKRLVLPHRAPTLQFRDIALPALYYPLFEVLLAKQVFFQYIFLPVCVF